MAGGGLPLASCRGSLGRWQEAGGKRTALAGCRDTCSVPRGVYLLPTAALVPSLRGTLSLSSSQVVSRNKEQPSRAGELAKYRMRNCGGRCRNETYGGIYFFLVKIFNLESSTRSISY